MPYKSEKIRLNDSQDRRKRLSESQRAEIRKLYETGLYSLNNLAKRFLVSKKTVLLIVNKDSAAKAKLYRKEHWKEYQQTKEEHNKAIRETRRYKQMLYEKGKLTNNDANE